MADQFLKLLMIGDSGVGKSCILSRYCENKFTDAFYNTIGVDFKTKTISLEEKKIKLQIWDTAGQERFRTITSNYYKGAHGILIVFDVTDPTSLKDVSYWLEEIQRHGNTHCATVLIGNKTDLQSKRQVSEDQGLEFANKNKLDYIECSALNAINIDLVFETIAKKVLRERVRKDDSFSKTSLTGKTGTDNSINQLKKDDKSKKKASDCC